MKPPYPKNELRRELRPALATVGAFLLLLVLDNPASAQWARGALTTNPPARAEHVSAIEAGTGNVLVFGGLDTSVSGGITFGDTWRFNGIRWQQQFPLTSPPARARSAMATDTARGVSVLFDGSAGLGDTWEWNGVNWTQILPATSPSSRTMHAMTFDPVAGLVVLFGGRGGLSLGDTWTFNGVNWTLIPPTSPTPPARENHTLEFDPALGLVLLFGGQNGAALFGDTWALNTVTGVWTQLAPATSPPARGNHAMHFDPGLGRIMMSGGSGGTANFADHWSWNGATWSPATTALPPTFEGHSLDTGLFARVVCFGGRNMGQFSGETFLRPTGIRPLGEAVPSAQDESAQGCASPLNSPRLSSDTLPTLGSTYVLDLNGFTTSPGNPVATLSIGLFPATQSCVAPLSMGHIPGIVNTLFLPTGSLSFPIAVPTDIGLAGLQVFSQAFANDAVGAFIMTNQTRVAIGF